MGTLGIFDGMHIYITASQVRSKLEKRDQKTNVSKKASVGLAEAVGLGMWGASNRSAFLPAIAA
jgi:hypothetical protein